MVSNPKSPAKLPSWNADDLRRLLHNYDRSPFLDLLATWMECAPNVQDIRALARRKPDIWVKALSDLGRLAGFTEKQEILHTHRLDQLSDSQLEDMGRALAIQMGLPWPERPATLELERNADLPVASVED